MAWLNLIAILLLTKPALKVLKDYEVQRKAGKDPIFDPSKVEIDGADFWEEKYREIESGASKDKVSTGGPGTKIMQ
jgi:AGCS family alanine or glycine:cation symporter